METKQRIQRLHPMKKIATGIGSHFGQIIRKRVVRTRGVNNPKALHRLQLQTDERNQTKVFQATEIFLDDPRHHDLRTTNNQNHLTTKRGIGAANLHGLVNMLLQISGYVRAKDVDYLPRVATDQWTGDTIIYSHLGGEVVYLPKNATIPITLKSREYKVFTVVPVKEFSNNEAKLGHIGLIKMFNSGGAIKELRYDEAEGTATVDMKVRGCGLFGAYSSAHPMRIQIDSEEVQFGYNQESGLVTLDLRVPVAELYLWNVTIGL